MKNKWLIIPGAFALVMCILTVRQAPVYAEPGWSNDIRVSSSPDDSIQPTVVIDSDNNVFVAWADGVFHGYGWRDDIFYAKLDRDRAIVTPPTRLSFPGWQAQPSLTVDSGNNVHVVWENWMGPAWMEELFHRVLYASGAVSAGSQLTSTPSRCNTDIPALAFDANNNLHLVYQDEVNDPIDGDENVRRDLFYKKFKWDGSRLTPLAGPVELTTAEGAGYPNVGYVNNLGGIALDASGNVHIVWADWRDYNSPSRTEIYYMKLDNSGNRLVNETRLTSVDGFSSRSPKLAVDSVGHIHIVWSDSRDGDGEIYYRKIGNGGVTLTSDVRITNEAALSVNPSVAVDSSDNLHVIWTDSRDGNPEVYYLKLNNNGHAAGNSERITPADGNSSSVGGSLPPLLVDSDDRIHVVWQDTRDGNVEIYYKVSANVPPVADAGPDQTVECGGPNGSAVTLDGSVSSDPDGDALTYTWTWNGGTASGVDPTLTLPLGTHAITLTVDDGKDGTATDIVTITVRDTTAPVTTVQTIAGIAGSNGWYTSDVLITVDSADSCSGVKEIRSSVDGNATTTPSSTATIAVSGDGAHGVTFGATDNAGNVELPKTLTINIDKTAPDADISVTPDLLWPPNHKMMDVLVYGGATDGASGVTSVVFTVTDEYGTVQPAVSGFNTTIPLEAWREGTDRDGRHYTITAVITDKAGNTTTVSSEAVCPHDMRDEKQ